MSRRILAVVPALALAGALAACGSNGAPGAGTNPSGSASSAGGTSGTSGTSGTAGSAAAYAQTPVAQIKSDVESALKDATSLHMAGSIVESTQQIDFDVSLDTSGNCTGTMGLHGQTIELLGVGGDYYFKAPRAFWRSQDAAHVDQIWSIVGGKWVKMGSGSQGSEMSSLCNLTDFTNGLFGDKSKDRQTKVVGPSQFQGQPTVQLSGRSDSGSPTTIQVLAATPHYPVRLDAGRQGEMTFSRFDEPVSVTAPPPDEMVDLSQLG
jgi:hypothetical protein